MEQIGIHIQITKEVGFTNSGAGSSVRCIRHAQPFECHHDLHGQSAVRVGPHRAFNR